jgi:hypothetical protein
MAHQRKTLSPALTLNITFTAFDKETATTEIA